MRFKNSKKIHQLLILNGLLFTLLCLGASSTVSYFVLSSSISNTIIHSLLFTLVAVALYEHLFLRRKYGLRKFTNDHVNEGMPIVDRKLTVQIIPYQEIKQVFIGNEETFRGSQLHIADPTFYSRMKRRSGKDFSAIEFWSTNVKELCVIELKDGSFFVAPAFLSVNFLIASGLHMQNATLVNELATTKNIPIEVRPGAMGDDIKNFGGHSLKDQLWAVIITLAVISLFVVIFAYGINW